MHIRRKSRGRHRTIIRFRRTFPRGVIDRGKERELVEGTKLITHHGWRIRFTGGGKVDVDVARKMENAVEVVIPLGKGEGKKTGEEEKDATKTIISTERSRSRRGRGPRINLNIDMTLPESRPRSTERR